MDESICDYNDLPFNNDDNVTMSDGDVIRQGDDVISTGPMRRIYSEAAFEAQWPPIERQKTTIKNQVTRWCAAHCACSGTCVKDTLLRFFPFVGMLKKYNIRRDLIGDLVAGVTVGIVQIPQGMAYGLLAGISPEYGLYSSFFPVLVYFFFGTSNHISMGMFAITSLMVGSLVERFDCSGAAINETLGDAVTSLEGFTMTSMVGGQTEEELCRLGVATAVAFFGGMIQLLLGVLQLGWLTVYLSEPLTRGYTTASALYVMTSQVKYLFGLKLDRYSGPLNIFYTYGELLPKLPQSNVAAIVISAVCILVLAVFKEHIQPLFKKKFKVPFPVELLIVVGATMASYYGTFAETYDVDIVGAIPTGLPAPSVPTLSHVKTLLPSSISIAIVGYANSMSLATLFAKKHGYKVDATQELLAHGLSNTASSFFGCTFAAPSMSRTLVHEGAGAVTQLAGVFSCVIILFVLLFIGPLFSDLPKAVLGCIIVVSLKGMFLQFHDIKKLWNVDKVDLAIWMVTFLGTIFLDVDGGLVVGVVFSLLTVVYRTQRAHSAMLGRIPNTNIYRNLKKFDQVEEVTGIKLFRFDAPLHYANKDRFTEELIRRTGLDAPNIKIQQAKIKKAMNSTKIETTNGDKTGSATHGAVAIPESASVNTHTLVLDCSSMSYVDSMGVACLMQTIKEFREIGIDVSLACCKTPVRRTLDNSDFHEKYQVEMLFVSVHDAVLSAIETAQSSVFTDSISTSRM